MPLLSTRLYRYYDSLVPPSLPRGFLWLYPQQDPAVKKAVKTFLEKYYRDDRPRRLMLGINPGRFGAGITGINFTAPRQLREDCGIEHPFGNGSELSAEFIYRVIHAYGGLKAFSDDWFIGAVCPLGFVQEGKNINYYDDPKLLKAVRPFIQQQLDALLSIGFLTDHCCCVGGEKNYRFLSALNEEHRWFGHITPLPHPRFIMQYRRKRAEEYVREYVEVLKGG